MLMATEVEESEAKPESLEESASCAWSRVAAHIEAAIAAIPRPPYEVRYPRDIPKRVKMLCKQLQPKLKKLFEDGKAISLRIYGLLQDLVKRIADVCESFYEYISHKVKRFLKWISDMMHNLVLKLEHLD
eukprot:c39393_g1_i1 orf=355-744(+)